MRDIISPQKKKKKHLQQYFNSIPKIKVKINRSYEKYNATGQGAIGAKVRI